MIYEARGSLYTDVKGGYCKCGVYVNDDGDYYLVASETTSSQLPTNAIPLTWSEMVARHGYKAKNPSSTDTKEG